MGSPLAPMILFLVGVCVGVVVLALCQAVAEWLGGRGGWENYWRTGS